MKKTTNLALALAIFAFIITGCASGKNIAFDHTPTPLEGVWRNAREKYSDTVYTFTGNKWQFNSATSKPGSGMFVLKKDEIIFYKENGKKWGLNATRKYRVSDVAFRLEWQNVNAGFVKQPVEEFVTSGEMLSRFEGTWVSTSTQFPYKYTFSGNKFAHKVNLAVEGTFELNSRIIKLKFPKGIIWFEYEFKDNDLSLNIIAGDYDTSDYRFAYGNFKKQ